jgi:hypothetical protein
MFTRLQCPRVLAGRNIFVLLHQNIYYDSTRLYKTTQNKRQEYHHSFKTASTRLPHALPQFYITSYNFALSRLLQFFRSTSPSSGMLDTPSSLPSFNLAIPFCRHCANNSPPCVHTFILSKPLSSHAHEDLVSNSSNQRNIIKILKIVGYPGNCGVRRKIRRISNCPVTMGW